MRRRLYRLGVRGLRAALLRLARGGRPRGHGRRVTILLVSPWGMGGTIRTIFNMAGYLAERGWDVEVLGTYRRRREAFFGAFPPGVKVTALDDQRAGAEPRGALRVIRELTRRRHSVLLSPSDRLYEDHSLWTDLRLARALRGRTGFLMGTRPGLNLLAAELGRPGLVAIGQEHMNLRKNTRPLRRQIRRRYPGLDALTVLTDDDRQAYAAALDGSVDVVSIPNAVPDLGGAPADPSARVVLAAGRFRRQKGFDLLVEAWAQVASGFPDWRLRICGTGPERAKVGALIAERGLEGSVELAGRATNIGEEMAAASIFAMSSRFEGFPMILLEAMSKQMAVVSFDCPTGPGEIIEDGRNGRLVEAEDVAAFAAALRDLMADEGLRARCGAAARETAGGYRMDAIGPRWEALLERHAAAASV